MVMPARIRIRLRFGERRLPPTRFCLTVLPRTRLSRALRQLEGLGRLGGAGRAAFR